MNYAVLLLFFSVQLCLLAGAPEIDLRLSEGYRRERTDFTISGPAGRPDVLSELIFKEIDVYVTRVQGRISKGCCFLEGSAGYGHIFSGKVVDNDYYFSDRKGLFSHSKHNISGEYTTDCALRFGGSIGPLQLSGGYSGYSQKFRFKGGHGWADFDSLNSTFRAKWFGPEWGVGLKMALARDVDAFCLYRLLYPLCYHAKGYWNLREKSARHFELTGESRKSFGNSAKAAITWRFFPRWTLAIEYEFMKFHVRYGHMRVKAGRVPLNRASRTSNEVCCTIGYAF